MSADQSLIHTGGLVAGCASEAGNSFWVSAGLDPETASLSYTHRFKSRRYGVGAV